MFYIVLLVLLNLSLKVYTIALPSSHYQLPHTLHNCKCNLFFLKFVFGCVIDLWHYVSLLLYNIVIWYFPISKCLHYKMIILISLVTIYHHTMVLLSIFSVPYISSLWLIYFITRSLYLLISLIYFIPPPSHLKDFFLVFLPNLIFIFCSWLGDTTLLIPCPFFPPWVMSWYIVFPLLLAKLWYLNIINWVFRVFIWDSKQLENYW